MPGILMRRDIQLFLMILAQAMRRLRLDSWFKI